MWDTSLFRFLSLRVKGDDRRYYINIQTDSLDPIELWQHRLFLRTRNGRISYKKFDGMDRERVKTVGTSLIERKEGPFCLHVAEIKVLSSPVSVAVFWIAVFQIAGLEFLLDRGWWLMSSL